MSTTEYVFADRPAAEAQAAGAQVAGAPAGGHSRLVHHLALLLDQFTQRRLCDAGVHPGGRCLEIGAGAGSIAGWLAERAGPDGQVIATDLDTSHIPAHPRIVPLRHDIATDPLEDAGRFHLIHARLVLGHLPQREQIVGKLAEALVPGGALVIEEFHPSWDRCLMHSPDPEAARLFHSFHRAFLTVLADARVDTGWGLRAHQVMTGHGLRVDTQLWARAWRGGDAGAMLPYETSGQLRTKLVDAGMTAADIDHFRTLLRDPELVMYSNLAVSSIGRKITP